MVRVAIVPCSSYDSDEVGRAVADALGLCLGPGWARLLTEPVLLKPNALSASPPESGVCTHPAVLEAVLRVLRQAGVTDVDVGDSSGGSGTRPTATDRAFQVSGLGAAATRQGARLHSFDHEEARTLPRPGPEAHGHPLTLARTALEAGSIISLPKLKTHALTVLTGAVKNLYGCVPGAVKREYHRLNPTIEGFSALLVDIAAVLRPRFHIVDAVVAMEGEGPSGGQLRQVGLLVAGEDPVAVDAVLAFIAGLDPLDVPTTRLGAERGLGEADLDRIEVVGLSLEEARQRPFRLPAMKAVARRAPAFLTRWALGFLVTRPAFVSGACTRCGVCAGNCPVGALTVDRGRRVPFLDDAKCIGCFCCHELCPSHAVYIRYRNPLARLVLGGGRPQRGGARP